MRISAAIRKSSEAAPEEAGKASIIDVAEYAITNDGRPGTLWKRLKDGDVPEGLEVVADRLERDSNV